MWRQKNLTYHESDVLETGISPSHSFYLLRSGHADPFDGQPLLNRKALELYGPPTLHTPYRIVSQDEIVLRVIGQHFENPLYETFKINSLRSSGKDPKIYFLVFSNEIDQSRRTELWRWVTIKNISVIGRRIKYICMKYYLQPLLLDRRRYLLILFSGMLGRLKGRTNL